MILCVKYFNDFVSPATIIKLEQSYNSEDSEDASEGISENASKDTDIYEVIKHPVNKKASKEASDSSDQDSFYLSIRLGRRKQLKLHRSVDWDFGASTGDEREENGVDEQFRWILPQVRSLYLK